VQIFLFFALFISVLAVVFAIQNNAPATVTFAVWEYHGSLALILLITLAAGALISFFFSLPSNIRARWAIRQQRKKMNEMDNTITGLRTELTSAQTKLEESKAEKATFVPAPAKPASSMGALENDEEFENSEVSETKSNAR
jgi:putative membrane protein